MQLPVAVGGLDSAVELAGLHRVLAPESVHRGDDLFAQLRPPLGPPLGLRRETRARRAGLRPVTRGSAGGRHLSRLGQHPVIAAKCARAGSQSGSARISWASAAVRFRLGVARPYSPEVCVYAGLLTLGIR